MRTLLIRNALVLVTMDAGRREIAGGGVFVRGNVIEAVGPSDALPASADEVIDATGQVVLPGLVNTHHHMFQSLTRAVPAAQNARLFGWLQSLYPLWARLTPEMVAVSTQTAMAELLLSGCTTTSDHLYLYPNGVRLDDSIEAAAQIGMRFHAARGSMSVGESQGGLPPDALVEDEGRILADSRRLIERWHDPARFSMRRIVLAPCSPFSVSRDLMRESATLARSFGAAHGVSLHTHLAENDHDVSYTREKFGCTPAEYLDALGWAGRDVWCAHCVKLDPAGIRRFAAAGTGVAHCPCSNMRLASGIAPVRAMRAAGVAVGLGVDGSASNDAGHLLGEARMAMLLQRVGSATEATGAADSSGRPGLVSPSDSATWPIVRHSETDESVVGLGPLFSAREALELATRGGARVLGRDDIGALAPGMAADIVCVPTGRIGLAGGLHDAVAALLFCHVPAVGHSVVDGRVVVRDGELVTLDLPRLIERHDALARQLADAPSSMP